MKKLLSYLKSLKPSDRELFAQGCGTTYGYLRKAISAGETLRADLCMRIDRKSNRVVTIEDLRPDLAQECAHIRGASYSS